MILNIVGTMGAGKTTLVSQLMVGRTRGLAECDQKGRIRGYNLDVNGRDVHVVGNYGRVCGGCDGWKKDVICERIREAHKRHDDVIFEGLVVTTSFGSYVKFLRELAPRSHYFVFLHPPVEVCVERVLARRAARGADVKSFDPEGVVRHHAFVTRAIERAREMRAPHFILDWEHPLDSLGSNFFSGVIPRTTYTRKVA